MCKLKSEKMALLHYMRWTTWSPRPALFDSTLVIHCGSELPCAGGHEGSGQTEAWTVQDLQPHCAFRNRQVCLPASRRKCGIHARIAFFLNSAAISIEQTVQVAKFSWRQIFVGGFNHKRFTPQKFNPQNISPTKISAYTITYATEVQCWDGGLVSCVAIKVVVYCYTIIVRLYCNNHYFLIEHIIVVEINRHQRGKLMIFRASAGSMLYFLLLAKNICQ